VPAFHNPGSWGDYANWAKVGTQFGLDKNGSMRRFITRMENGHDLKNLHGENHIAELERSTMNFKFTVEG
jgi:hypothetical protein